MIKLNKIVKIYNKGQENQFVALKKVDMEIKSGEMVAIIGKSGAGKSTLLHILACIDSADEGEYYLNGEMVNDLKEKELASVRNMHIGFVMQDYALVEEFSSLENVMIPLDFAKKKDVNRKKAALDALSSVDMSEYAKKNVSKLSGGQKQRVAIARAIANKPEVLLADEPTGALDSATSKDIMKLFRKLNNEGTTVVIVTHDLELAGQCDRVIEMKDGCIEE